MQVRIYRLNKSSMQSGRAATKSWRIEPLLETARKPNDLMGWTSSEDTLNQIVLKFSSYESAVAYATKMGWQHEDLEPQERVIVPRSYVDNFKQRKTAV